jgi:hypothetical protein
MLNTAKENYYGFDYVDYSIPDHNPLLNQKGGLLTGPRLLTKAIESKITQSSVVLVPARMFTAQSDWVTKEIDYAKSIGTRVIAIQSRSTQRVPIDLRLNADSTIDANYRSLYNAITA